MRHTARTKASGAADKWLVGAGETRQMSTLLDQLGLVSARTSGSVDPPFSSPSHFCHLSLSFTLSLTPLSSSSCFQLIPLPFFSSPLSLFKAHRLPCPPHGIPKQGQSCNPLTATLSTDFAQINPERLAATPRCSGGKGSKEKSKCERHGKEGARHGERVKGENDTQQRQTEGTCVTVI